MGPDRRREAVELAAGARGLLVVADYGDERCGVGSSCRALVDRTGAAAVLDPRLRVGEFTRRARQRASAGAVVALEYPSRSTVYDARLLVRFIVLRCLFGRQRLRLHLHEFSRLRRKLRYPISAVLSLAGRVVVSSATEAVAVHAVLDRLRRRGTEVVVAPPANGAARLIEVVAQQHQAGVKSSPAARTRTVGVFGMYRPDKGFSWLVDALRRLEPCFDRLVIAGGGWDGGEWPLEWPPDITARFQIELLGHVPGDRLPAVGSEWGVAIAPFEAPPTDGRMSLRTVLALGVPTVTPGPLTGDLTLRPAHLLGVPPAELDRLPAFDDDARITAAETVAAFEAEITVRLADALFGGRPRPDRRRWRPGSFFSALRPRGGRRALPSRGSPTSSD